MNSCPCKANTIVSKVKLCVVRSNKNIPQDPEWSPWWWNIHGHETWQTDGSPPVTHLHQVVLGSQREVHSSNCEGNCWQRPNLSTILDIFIKDLQKMRILPIIISPLGVGSPPSILLMAFTSAGGPAIREVPVSAIAWHPPLHRVMDWEGLGQCWS